MSSDNWGNAFFLIFLGAVILTPIILRNRLLAKQLDALTIAMQQGIEPERVRESMLLRRDEGDINGNWKAGQVLVWLGVAYLPFGLIGMVAAASSGTANAGVFMAFLPGVVAIVVGACLRRIHRTIVGDVVRRGSAGVNLPPAAVTPIAVPPVTPPSA
jgi:hypothetical protein